MSELKTFKCPNCDGRLEFDTASQQLKCPYCDGTFDPAIFDEGKEYVVDNEKWNDDHYLVYTCKSCGGTIMADQDTAADSCPYCGNPIVVMGNVSGDFKPKKIIPFQQDKEKAKEEFRKHLKGKILLPKEFRSEATLDEIKGIYVPFWIFDGTANAQAWYNATRTHSWREGDYDVTETQYYRLYRSGRVSFASVPVNASKKMDNSLTESVEPFRYSDAKDFSDNYLAGFYADRYSKDVDDSRKLANNRIMNSTEQLFASTTSHFTSVTPTGSDIRVFNGKQEYVMYPMWLLNVNYKDKKYAFAMNGQTGKFVGDLPIDEMKYRFIMLGIFVITLVVLSLIQFLVIGG